MCLIDRFLAFASFIHLINLWISFATAITISRSKNGDGLLCEHNVDCSYLGATQTGLKRCSCAGTFRIRLNDGKMLCTIGEAAVKGCDFSTKVSTISVNKGAAEDFNEIVATTSKCYAMEIVRVEQFSRNMEWQHGRKKDFTITQYQEGYRIMWDDPTNVVASDYVGQILKFQLECQTYSGRKIESCFLGKVEGERSWDSYSLTKDVCAGGTPPTAFFTTKESSTLIPSTTISTVTSKNKTSDKHKIKDEKTKDGVSIGLIVGIVAGIIIIVLLAIVFYLCRRQSSRKDDDVKTEEKKPEGNKITQPKMKDVKFQNPSYLASIPLDSKKSNEDNMPPSEYSVLSTTDKEDANYEDPYNLSNHEYTYIDSETPYAQLTGGPQNSQYAGFT